MSEIIALIGLFVTIIGGFVTSTWHISRKLSDSVTHRQCAERRRQYLKTAHAKIRRLEASLDHLAPGWRTLDLSQIDPTTQTN